MRIVSLACSNTEIVAALGCAHLLVGVDNHSDEPADVLASLPRVGPDLQIDVRAVAALNPDLVLGSLTVPGHETVIEAVEAAGLPLLTLAPERLADIPADVERIALALAPADPGVIDRGDALARELTSAFAGPVGGRRGAGSGAAGLHAAGALVEGGAGAPRADTDTGEGADRDALPRVLIQWWPKPVIAPGNRSWAHDLIELAGGRNLLQEDACLSRPISDEDVAARNPDLIVVSWCGVHPDKYRPEVVLRNPAFGQTSAIRQGRVLSIPEAWLGRPGPRLLNGLSALRSAVTDTIGTMGDPTRCPTR
jgi:iron complex transport system substrate-binding protein